jgi:hypothetical protein
VRALILLAVSIGMTSCAAQYRPLPHRPMHDIDVQGHLDLVPATPCPAVYDAPNGELRFCL